MSYFPVWLSTDFKNRPGFFKENVWHRDVETEGGAQGVAQGPPSGIPCATVEERGWQHEFA